MSAQATIAAAARGMHHLVPSTFEARGATVPFTTPILAHSRVRKDWRDRFELVVIGFSGGVGDYVLPWKAVADLLSLTAHDTLLHQELQGREALDPHDVRHVALEVAKTGLAGPDVSEAANRAFNVDEEGRTVNEMMLMLGVIEDVEPAETAALAAEVTTTTGQHRIRDTFAALGSRMGPRFNSLERLLPELTRLTYTIGLPNTPAPGRLRRIVQRLEEFRRSISAWGSERLGVAAEEAGFCAKISGHTLRVAALRVAEFDSIIASPRTAVENWKISGPRIEQLADRLEWLVDGWEPIVETWLGAQDDARRIDVLSEIVPILPVMPRNEWLRDSDAAEVVMAPGVGRRWVHTNEDWRTGEPDSEMVQRLEALKVKTL